MAAHNRLGKIGETLALQLLEKKQYQILEQNWRHGKAEIDLIAKDGEVLVFIEVKTRSTNAFGPPEAFVNAKKKRLLIHSASIYMEQISHDWEIRFDIIAIISNEHKTEIRHMQDAFFPGL